MAWYDNAVFYHIYPLGLTGAPAQNDYGEPVHRLRNLMPWIAHIRDLGCSALYIGPLFESVGHGYETTDYRKLDSRLGTNDDLKDFVAECHCQGIRVILDGVFNHVGRDFFAFKDLQQNRENSPYRDWFCNVNFWNNNEYNDGFSYDNWGGYNLLVKLNQRNPSVQDHLCSAIRMWVDEFDIDGLRLDAADVLDFGFMQTLRRLADEVKPEFWLMGEVIHGDYTRWVNGNMLDSVTDYTLHKALYSGHNDHNYFEIAHTVKRLYDMGLNRQGGMKLYSFVDNHDVERIYTKLSNKAHFTPVHILLYTLPGIPSIYYGSEFGIEGAKGWGSDAPLRPVLDLKDYADALTQNPCTRLIAALGPLRRSVPALMDGDYRELQLTTRQYVFSRTKDGNSVIVAVNNDDAPAELQVPADGGKLYTGALSGETLRATDNMLRFTIPGNSGEVWVPEGAGDLTAKPVLSAIPEKQREESKGGDNDGQAGAAEPKPGAAGSSDAAGAKEETEEAGAKAEAGVETKPGASDGQEEAVVETKPDVASTPGAKPEAGVAAATKPGASNGQAAAAESKPGAAITPGAAETKSEKIPVPIPRDKSYEEMTVEELQSVILEKLAKNGPVTDQMRRDVEENIWHDSLVNWARSF